LGGAGEGGGGIRDPWFGGCFVQRIEMIVKLFQIVTPAPHPLKQEICSATTLADDAVLRREGQRGEGPQRRRKTRGFPRTEI